MHLLFDGCSAAQTCKKVLLESAYHGVFSFVPVNAAQGNPSIIWRQPRDSVEAVIVGRFFQNPHLEGPDFLKYRTIFT